MDLLYAREKKKLADDMVKWLETLQDPLFQRSLDDMKTTPEEFIHRVMEKSLYRLNQRYYPPQPDNEKSHLWIGVNPPPDTINLSSLYSKLITALSRYKWIDEGSYIASVEAHTEGGYRPHIHLLISHSPLEKPNRVIKALATHFKVNASSIQCKAYHKGLLYQEHIDYIMGDKCEAKQDNVVKDNKERDDLGIPNVIGKLTN